MVIGRFLAERHGLGGSNEWNKATAEMIAHFIEDIYPKGYFALVKGHLENDDKAKVFQSKKKKKSKHIFSSLTTY